MTPKVPLAATKKAPATSIFGAVKEAAPAAAKTATQVYFHS